MAFDKEHIVHYFIILGIVISAIGMVVFFSFDKSIQFWIVVGFSVSYGIYSILHHYLKHDLTIKIVIEYILITLLVIAAFIFIKGGL